MTFVHDIVNNPFIENFVLTSYIENIELFPIDNGRLYSVYNNKILGKFFYYLEFCYKYLHFPLAKSKKLLIRIVDDNKIDCFFCQFSVQGTFWIDFLKKSFPEKKVIVMFHGFDVYQLPKLKSYRKKIQKLFEKIDFAIVVSNKMKSDLIELGCPKSKIRTIYLGLSDKIENSINVSKINNKLTTEKEIIFLHYSGFTEKKGLEFLFKSLILLGSNKLDKKLKFIFIGDGQEKKKIIELSNQIYNCNISISFLEHLSTDLLVSYLENAHYFIQTSVTGLNGDQEGLPQSIKEALYYGLPVITTYHSGITEIIETGKDGFLVNENDYEGLLKTFQSIIQYSQTEYLELSNNASIKSKIFSRNKYQFELFKTLEMNVNFIDNFNLIL
jgi:glycosyltransferase involved in cell wall biosynthesis